MWAIRILSGTQAGQVFPLNSGKFRIGRGSTCEIKINSNSVSKEHAAVLATGDKLIITDSNSRNGTFVNGVRIQNQRLDIGDKVSLHDVLLDVVQVPNDSRMGMSQHGGNYVPAAPAWAGNAAVRIQHQYQQNGGHAHQSASQVQMNAQMNAHPHAQHQSPQPQQQMSATSVAALFNNFQIYIDNVAMPGVYAIVRSMSFRVAICALVLIYVVIVTALSTIPVVNTTKQNIKQESIRRAKTIARNMAANNRAAIVQNNEMQMSIRQAELEEGVTTAVIINAKDGTILAPANRRGEFVNKPFIQKARRQDVEIAEFIDDSNLGVSVPISVYSAEGGNQTILAYAVVLYDMGALAINASQTFGLFIQTLAIALLIGFVLWFFLYKITEHPIDTLNSRLDDALREGRDDLTTDYQFPPLERLVSNINSALSRIDRNAGNGQKANFVNRDTEAYNLIDIVTTAALAISAVDGRIVAANDGFSKLLKSSNGLNGRPITDITDSALQQQLQDLVQTLGTSTNAIASGQIPFDGRMWRASGQTIMGSEGPAYYIITFAIMET